MLPAKVTALITRHVEGRAELCVFDHAGWVQLPAGSIEPGEPALGAAVREAWEETGLPRLEVVAKLGTIEDDSRVLYHLRATEAMPDEWWVLTPDGGGSEWRCRWVPLDAVDGMHDAQRAWIDAVRDLLDVAAPVERLERNPPEVTEVYDATLGVRFLTETVDRGAPLAWVSGICVTADGDAVIVTHDATRGWGLPGTRPQPEETAADALARAVLADAGARVVATEPLLSTHDRFLDDSRRVIREHATAALWARVELDDWQPPVAGAERRLVPLVDLVDELRWELPVHVRLHRLAWEREGRS